MNRFCDYIEIYKNTGDIYNPFATKESEEIIEEKIFAGDCKAIQHSTNAVDGECYYDICINSNDIMANARDVLYLYNNGREDDKIKLTIVEVKRYERNTLIKALHTKDGSEE